MGNEAIFLKVQEKMGLCDLKKIHDRMTLYISEETGTLYHFFFSNPGHTVRFARFMTNYIEYDVYKEYKKAYLVLVCGDENLYVVFPVQELAAHRDSMGYGSRNNGWRLLVKYLGDGRMIWHLPSGQGEKDLDVTDHVNLRMDS